MRKEREREKERESEKESKREEAKECGSRLEMVWILHNITPIPLYDQVFI